MASTALQTLDHDWAIDQIANGAFLRDLSAQTGIDKRRLSEQLRKHPDYASAKESAIECQLDDAQEAIRLAADQQDIACARERFRAAAWRAEREASHRWGAKQQIAQTVEHQVAPTDLTQLARELAFLLAKGVDQHNAAIAQPQRSITHNETVDAQVIDSKAD